MAEQRVFADPLGPLAGHAERLERRLETRSAPPRRATQGAPAALAPAGPRPRPPAPSREEQLVETYRAAAARYSGTDHDSAAGRLVQGQVDHTLMIGHRVAAAEGDFAEMAARFRAEGFGAEHATGLEQLDKCPACSRALTHGDFGVDHIMYYLDGDDEKKPAGSADPAHLVHARSAARSTCGGRTSRAARVAAWRDEWEDFVRSVERDQKAGDVILHLDTLCRPRSPTRPRAREARGGRRGRGRGRRGRGRRDRGGGRGGRGREAEEPPTPPAWKWRGAHPARRGAPKKHRGQVRVHRLGRERDGRGRPGRARVRARGARRARRADRARLGRGRRRARPPRGRYRAAPALSDIAREVTEPGVCVLAEQPPPETPTAVEGMMRKTDSGRRSSSTRWRRCRRRRRTRAAPRAAAPWAVAAEKDE